MFIDYNNINELIEYMTCFGIPKINTYITNEPFVLKQQGVAFEVISPIAYGVDYYGDIVFTSEQELADHPDRVEAFRRATLQGWRLDVAAYDGAGTSLFLTTLLADKGLSVGALRVVVPAT